MTGILEGVKVLEMGHAIAMPAASAMLADWGADVIKIEPLTGDMIRGTQKTLGTRGIFDFNLGEVNWAVELHNRNKRGLALDLTKELAREALYRLVKKSDVFMSNYEVNAIKKLKVDYATLSQINPRLIYAVITGYGMVGPDKDERGFDFTAAWARTGMQYMTGDPGSPPPMQRPAVMDRTAGAYVTAGILGAIVHRDKTGKGQEVHCSLYHTGTWSMALDIQAALMGTPLSRHDRTKSANPLMNPYQAGDGRWFLLVMPQSNIFWPMVCRVIERPDLEHDPRFDIMEKREENCEELIRLLDEIFATRDRGEWQKRLKENKCIHGLVQTPSEVITDPQAIANNFFSEVYHPAGGMMKLVNTPVNFSQNPASVRAPAPEIGQHTEEILLDLDYNWDDIARFKDEGIIL